MDAGIKNLKKGTFLKRDNHPVRVMDFRGTYKGGGGPDKTILNSAAQHDHSKVDVLVTYLRDPKDKEYSIDRWAEKLGVNYVDVPDRKQLDFRCIKLLKELIDRQGIELIHAHDDKTMLYGWILKLLRPQVRIMYTCHSHPRYTMNDFNGLPAYLSFLIRRNIQIFLMKRFQKPVLTIANHTRETLISHGLRPENVVVLHNGIDTDVWQPQKGNPVLRHELDIPHGVHLVGTVARIAQRDKDLSTFYKVAAKVIEQVPNVRFVIVGDGHGDEMARAKNEAASLGLGDKLFFTGHRTDLIDVYSSLDVFLMTSRSEGMPNTILEAMAMGLPVVSTIVGGVPEIIRDETMGLLAPVGDVETLNENLCILLNSSLKRAEISGVARKRIEEQFSFLGRVREMEKYYSFFSE